MVTASELRIGNYIEECIFNSVCKRGILESDFMDIETFLEKINPIPINREALLKFGFTNFTDKNTKARQFEKGNIQIYCNDDFSDITFHCDFKLLRKIEFVHELQNLYFDLKKEELQWE